MSLFAVTVFRYPDVLFMPDLTEHELSLSTAVFCWYCLFAFLCRIQDCWCDTH